MAARIDLSIQPRSTILFLMTTIRAYPYNNIYMYKYMRFYYYVIISCTECFTCYFIVFQCVYTNIVTILCILDLSELISCQRIDIIYRGSGRNAGSQKYVDRAKCWKIRNIDRLNCRLCKHQKVQNVDKLKWNVLWSTNQTFPTYMPYLYVILRSWHIVISKTDHIENNGK